MERAQAGWTDERLDDLQRSIEAGFGRVDEDLRSLSTEFNSLQRTMLQVGGGLIAGMFAMVAAFIATLG